MDVVKDCILIIEKIFSVFFKLVWEVWVDLKYIVKWWGFKGMDVEVLEYDFRVGGNWKYKMVMFNGGEFIIEGQYIEIVEMERIVSSVDFKLMIEGVIMEMLFIVNGDKIDFVFNVIYFIVEYCKQQEEMGFYNGWGLVFENLVDYVQQIQEQNLFLIINNLSLGQSFLFGLFIMRMECVICCCFV